MIVLVQALVVLSGTFILPAQLTLANKYISHVSPYLSAFLDILARLTFSSASPHATALGRTHSLAVFLLFLARSVSPVAGGFLFAYGFAHSKGRAV